MGLVEVALIAPVRAYRDALAAAMSEGNEFKVVCLASSAPEALARMSQVPPPVALLDFGIDDLMQLLSSLRRVSPATQLIGMGVCETAAHSAAVVAAAEAGLVGFVDADQPVSDIATAVRLAIHGQSSCSPRIAALLLQALRRLPAPPPMPLIPSDPSGATLTSRERVVAELIATGLSNRQIATHLILGESTVKSHVHSILGKLGLSSRDQVLPARCFPLAVPSRLMASAQGGDRVEAEHPPTD
ncbi:DNA-binding NarL/FixJ family response regulator [Arthrobacter oryzae]|nr:DNA-binding NarL/FixJ family response regulator [Arthrobacter oryzae]